MAIFRINKTSDYTVISNYHFKEKEMSLKSKGLLSFMLSLPENWNYSISGLVACCKENESAIISTLSELKYFGYLKIIKLMPNETKTGRIEYVYDIYELPNKKQDPENQGLEIQGVENQGQLITNESITNNNTITNKLVIDNIYTELPNSDKIENKKSITIHDSNTVNKEILNTLSSDEENLKEESLFEIFNSDTIRDTSKSARLSQTIHSNGSLAKEIFDYWNTKKLRIHRAYQSKYLERINKLFNFYSVEQIKNIIDNYSECVNCEKFYWTHIWDLQDFIDIDKERYKRFEEEGDVYISYTEQNKKELDKKKSSHFNEEYNEAIKEGKDIRELDDMHAEHVRNMRKSPNVIKL